MERVLKSAARFATLFSLAAWLVRLMAPEFVRSLQPRVRWALGAFLLLCAIVLIYNGLLERRRRNEQPVDLPAGS